MAIEAPPKSEQLSEDAVQLHSELRTAVTGALSRHRPVLHHLNADSSWLLQIPRPAAAVRHGGRLYFNVLIDPWLKGPQVDVGKWLSRQWHAIESKFGSIAEVEALAGEIERLSSEGDAQKVKARRNPLGGSSEKGAIDVVAISHEFTDHCHKETLLEIHPDVPVIATKKAAELISSWSHFRTVLTTPSFAGTSPDWREKSLEPLPTWISISRIVSSKDALYYHSALLICFNSLAGQSQSSDSNISDAAEAVIYTPHGVTATSLSIIPDASPPLSVLAFLHGLHDISLGPAQQLNLGGHNGLAAQRVLKAKYWVGTHDEQKRGMGLVSFILKRKIISLGDALEEERKKRKERREKNGSNGIHEDDEDSKMLNDTLDEFEDARFAEMANGESRVLD